MDRPALKKLLIDVLARRIDVIVVYKVDRLTRSLADFAKLVETFDAHGVSFVSVTQSFNTASAFRSDPLRRRRIDAAGRPDHRSSYN
jgi:site-specific DNA recombinase